MHAVKWTQLLGRVALIAALSGTSLSNAYTWPNPLHEELDSQLYDRTGYGARGLAAGMLPDCTFFFFGNNTARANAADWIRTVSELVVLC